MNLYIRIKDGQPFEHPLFEDNVKQVWPNIDLNNLPPELARFERVQPPVPQTYEVLDGFSYQLVDGVYKDVWHLRPMTDSERQDRNKKFTESLNAGKAYLTQQAQEKMAVVNDAGKTALQDYINQLSTFTPSDITKYVFPSMPKFDKQNNLITNDSPGTVPNVVA